MKIKIWNELEDKPKRFVRFGRWPPLPHVIAWIVDESGERVDGGSLLHVNEDGSLGRSRSVNATAAELAGIPLDDEGRWKLG